MAAAEPVGHDGAHTNEESLAAWVRRHLGAANQSVPEAAPAVTRVLPARLTVAADVADRLSATVRPYVLRDCREGHGQR